MMQWRHSLKTKIILICMVCAILVSVFSSVYLYAYLSNIISEKAEHVEALNMQTLQNRVSQELEELCKLGTMCADDLTVAHAMEMNNLDSTSNKNKALKASSQLQTYLDGASIQNYVNRLVAFNEYGVYVATISRSTNSSADAAAIMQLPLFEQLPTLAKGKGIRQIVALSTSLGSSEPCIALLSPVYDYVTSTHHGWVYIELNLRWLSDVVAPYVGSSYVLYTEDSQILYGENTLENFNLLLEYDQPTYRKDDNVYRLRTLPVRIDSVSTVWLDQFTLLSISDVTILSNNGLPILYTVLVVLVTSLLLGFLLAIGLSNIISRPLQKLTGQIVRLTKNDFTPNPEIEQGTDEIAQTGRIINEMTISINSLLENMEDMYAQRKNAEIAMLQSQVNPHFLYNTLDSIRWMAVIQKNTGIANMSKSLSNLLRNLAKGVGDKIPLSEELDLLQDYIAIQSIRYIETFRYDNLVPESLKDYSIIKLTLQPLVENAIFHGIEPTGRFGVIKVTAHEDGDYLIITVEDDGQGMPPEVAAGLTTTKKESTKNSLSGIGASNVHERLRLHYGKECGLHYESVEHQYTKAMIRIPKEPYGGK